jgi:hypothetical protein
LFRKPKEILKSSVLCGKTRNKTEGLELVLVQGAVTPVDCFSLFLPDHELEKVVNLTINKINMMMDSLTEDQLASVPFASD